MVVPRFDGIYRSPRRAERKRRAIFFAGRRLIVAICIVCAIGSGLYVFLFSRYFTIDSIAITANDSIDPREIREMIFEQMDNNRIGIIPQKNIAIFDTRELRKRIQFAYMTQKLRIRKKFPNRLTIDIQGTPFSFIWVSKGIQYDIDNRGIAAHTHNTERITTSPGVAFQSNATSTVAPAKQSLRTSEQLQNPTVIDVKNSDVAIGQSVMRQDMVDFILPLRQELHEIGVDVDRIETSQDSQDLILVTKEGWTIAMIVTESRKSQIAYLKILLDQKIKKDRVKLKVVDVRFGNHLYYTTK